MVGRWSVGGLYVVGRPPTDHLFTVQLVHDYREAVLCYIPYYVVSYYVALSIAHSGSGKLCYKYVMFLIMLCYLMFLSIAHSGSGKLCYVMFLIMLCHIMLHCL